jgi:hypothetical protein
VGKRGGPKSAKGKEVVSKNAISHGVTSTRTVIPGESEDEWDSFRSGVRDSLRPVGVLETELADRVAHCLWRRRRLDRFETAMLETSQAAIGTDVARYRRSMSGAAGGSAGLELTMDQLAEQVELSQTALDLAMAFAAMDDDVVMPLEEADAILYVYAAAQVNQDFREAVIEATWGNAECSARRVREAISQLAQDEDLEVYKEHCLHICLHRLVDDQRELQEARLYESTLQAQRTLPDESALNMIIRYESHLRRDLQASLHELEALQARRRGDSAPLLRVDVAGPQGETAKQTDTVIDIAS